MQQRIFAIGASTGGIEALCRLVAALPADFPAPILVVQHVAADGPGLLPRILARAGRLPAGFPSDGELLAPGRIYVAPPDRHLLVEQGRARLSRGPRENFVRPAIDALFRSAALAYGSGAVGVVLTGMLHDGAAGLLAIKERQGVAIVQDPAEAAAPSMPRSALRLVPVDHCLALDAMPAVLLELARDDPPEPAMHHASRRRLIEIENRIAAGIFTADDWGALEQASVPSGLNCPDCRSALYELNDQPLLRFRCRSGHAYTARALLAAQAEAWETQLSTLFGLGMEEAALARRVMAMDGDAGDQDFTAGLRGRIERREHEAAQVADWLHAGAAPD